MSSCVLWTGPTASAAVSSTSLSHFSSKTSSKSEDGGTRGPLSASSGGYGDAMAITQIDSQQTCVPKASGNATFSLATLGRSQVIVVVLGPRCWRRIIWRSKRSGFSRTRRPSPVEGGSSFKCTRSEPSTIGLGHLPILSASSVRSGRKDQNTTVMPSLYLLFLFTLRFFPILFHLFDAGQSSTRSHA